MRNRLLRWCKGYLEISVEGSLGERFLSACGRRQIPLWEIGSGEPMRARILAKDFLRIREVAAQSGNRVRIVRRYGVGFLLHRYRHRKLFAAGAVLFVAALVWAGSVVWRVEVIGAKQTDPSRICEVLEQNGVRRWAWKRSVDPDRIKLALMQRFDTLAWAAVRVRGANVTVELRERVMPPEMLAQDQPTDLIASADGVVEKLLIREGEAKTAVGDTVRRGQLLASAEKGADPQRALLVHSFGEVIARTWRVKERKKPLVWEEKTLTGREKTRFSITFSKFFIKFYGNSGNLYPSCDTIEETVWKTDLFTVKRHRFRELSVRECHCSEQEAAALAEEEMTREVTESAPDGTELISVRREIIGREEQTISVRCTFECRENIALCVPYRPNRQGELHDDTTNNDTAPDRHGDGNPGQF